MRTWLSVDWDFFVRENPAWDWTHSESPFYQELMWPIRAISALARGVDLRAESDPQVHADVRPEEFWEVLTRAGFRWCVQELWISDSHAIGCPAFLSARPGVHEPVLLLNVDAHHDLGYNVTRLTESLQSDVSYCDDWLFHLLRLRPETFARIVYPGWKGLEEWEAQFSRSDWRSVLQAAGVEPRVGAATWSETPLRSVGDSFLEQVARVQGTEYITPTVPIVEQVVIVRSGAWSPPWLDESFARFVSDAEARTGCSAYVWPGHADPRVPRTFPAWEQIAGAAQIEGRLLRGEVTPEELVREQE